MESIMSTIQQNGSAVTVSSTKNRGGSAKRAGASSTVLSNISIGVNDVGVFASTVVDGTATDPAVAGGVFAYNNQKPVARRVTTSLSTVSNSVLLSGAGVPSQVRSINKREYYVSEGTSTAFRAGYFNLYTGKYSPAPTPVVETPGTDNAASPTRSAPGKLVFRSGSRVPTSQNYSTKNG
jgi:hypothetical protein